MTDHWASFREFARWERAAGGPDPQLRLVALMSEGQPVAERIWRVGCCLAVWNVPFGEFLWREWPWARMVAEPEDFNRWCVAHWGQIVTRIERRCVRRADWMTQFILGYRAWALALPEHLTQWEGYAPTALYDRLWDSALTVPRLGRYIALKLLDFLQQACDVPAEPSDIRPRGGWSPRAAMNLLVKDVVPPDDDSAEMLAAVNLRVAQLQDQLRAVGTSLTLFELQVLLCEYRECYEGERQYPGRSMDSELGYAHKAERLGCPVSPAFAVARQRLCPTRHLGELSGWDGPRNALGPVLRHYGYVWTDVLFDFKRTTFLGEPVRWDA